MTSSKIFITGLVVLFQFGCASVPFPYFDSAMNDHNRAPASLGTPAEYSSTTIADEVEQKIKLDTNFLRAELQSLSGETENAIESFKSAIVLDPQSEVLSYRLAVEYYRKGQLRDALYWGEKSLTLKPDKRETVLFVAGLLSAQKEVDRAEKLYKSLIKKSPSDSEAHLYLAALYSEKQEYDKALSHFSTILKQKNFEQKYLAYYYRARVYIESGSNNSFAQAKKDLNESLRLKPDFFDALQVLGRIYEKNEGPSASYKFFARYQKEKGPIGRIAEILSQYYIEKGDYDSAYEQLEILESTTDDQIQIKLKMALILIDKKMYDKAQAKLLELKQIVPESDKVKFYLAAVYQETKNIDLAIETFLEIQSASNHYEDSRIQSAILLKNMGQSERALSIMKDAISKKSENVQSYFTISQILEDLKKYDEGISYLQSADKKFPKNSQIHYFLGTLFDRKNDKTNMLAQMNKVIEIDSDHVQALNYVAYSLAEMKKDLGRAEKLALRAAELDKSDAFIKDTIGWVYYQQGEFEKAIRYLEKAHKLLPDVGIIADHLGDAYLKVKKNDKAFQAFQKAFDLENNPEKKKEIQSKISEVHSLSDLREPASK